MLPIPRGRISHTISDEVRWLLKAATSTLTDTAKVTDAEKSFATYVGRAHCVVFPYARTAIWSILKSLDLPVGSKVLLPPLTIKPILDVVIHLGLDPIFVDIDQYSACFDETCLVKALEERPSVAILTYLFGRIPDVERLTSLLRSRNVFIIEDFSQCLNGEFDGKKIGTYGDVSVYSASSIKTFDTFGGGFALTDSDEVAQILRRYEADLIEPSRKLLLKTILRNLGRNLASSRVVFSTVTFWLLQIFAVWNVSSIGKFTGRRSQEPLGSLPSEWFVRYSSIQAMVALHELPRVTSRDQMRISKVDLLRSLLNFKNELEEDSRRHHIYWQYVIVVKNFKDARRNLAHYGIDCATTSLVLLTNLPKYPNQKPTPVATRLYTSGVYLPCFHQLRESEVRRIAKAFNRIGDDR